MAELTINNEYCGAPCFGYLYNWYAVDDSRGLTSSDDWVVPSNSDMATFNLFLESDATFNSNTIGKKLKETGAVFWFDDTGENTVGFGLRGGGRRLFSGAFSNLRDIGGFWHSDDRSVFSSAYFSYAKTDTDVFNTYVLNGGYVNYEDGKSVRLVNPSTTLSDGETGTYTGNDGKVYNTICIGTQEWLSENLEETEYRNGDYIQGYDGGVYTPIGNTAWSNLTTGALCLYEDNLNYKCK